MSKRKVIGVTVGTPISPNKIADMIKPVKSVNGKTGAVQLSASDVGALSASELPNAINTALAQAAASGEFDGKDGYTPVKGIDYFDGEDGKDGTNGKDGYTPQKGVDYFDGKNGQDGKNGAPGKTPERGTDYWTPEDRAAMVQDVLAALPIWEGGSY